MLCHDSGMEGHTQKYHMSDNADWPKLREAGTHLIYTRQLRSLLPDHFSRAQYLQTTGKPVDEIETYQTTQQCRRMII